MGDRGMTSLKRLKHGITIREINVTTNTTDIDIIGLDGDRDKTYSIESSIENPTASDSEIYIYFNEDYTKTNYFTQWAYSSGTTRDQRRENYPLLLFLIAGTSGFCFGEILRTPDGLPRWKVEGTCGKGDTLAEFHVGGYRDIAENITSIRIHSTVTGAIGAGSRIILRKLT